MKSYFESLARYNRWANRRLYGAVAGLSADEIAAPRTGFFPSLLKTLNHLIVADRIWLSRLTATPDPDAKALDQIIAADFAGLTAQRATLDERIIAVVRDLAPGRLGEVLVYKTMAGSPFETPIDMVLAHMFNHQTHHRGQAHGMLSGTAVPPPSLDMIVFLREEATA
ncbi:MAG: damage-inducible protein DinB [Proteobacteria bacterium]|nr:damage-inducible protein DinB [Pseudomonadota bacterium]